MPARRTTQGRGDVYLQYIRSTVLLSAANTFTQVTIALPVVISQGYVLQMHSIDWQVPELSAMSEISATDDELGLECQLTKASQTAMVRLDDPDCIDLFHRHYYGPAARTAESKTTLIYQSAGDLTRRYDTPILLVSEQIYLSATTVGAAAAFRYNVRIGFTTVKLAPRQIVEIVQALT